VQFDNQYCGAGYILNSCNLLTYCKHCFWQERVDRAQESAQTFKALAALKEQVTAFSVVQGILCALASIRKKRNGNDYK
jgi:hypothetical protein